MVKRAKQGDAFGTTIPDDVLDSLQNDFARDMTIAPIFTQVVMWVDVGQKLEDLAEIPSLRSEVLDSVMSSASDPDCSQVAPTAGSFKTSPDGSAEVLEIMQGNFGTAPGRCELLISDKVKKLNGRVKGVSVAEGTELAVTYESFQKGLDMITHHLKFLCPVLFVILVLVIGSIPRAYLTFAVIGATVVFSQCIVYIIHCVWPAFNVKYPDQQSYFIFLALGIDYALFFWTRFSQERRKNPEPEFYDAAISKTLETSGCVILISVLALTVAYIGLSFYPYINATGNLKMNLNIIIGVLTLGVNSLAYPAALGAHFPSLFDEPTGDEMYVCGVKCESLGRMLKSIAPLSFYFNRCSSWVTRFPFKFMAPLVALAGFIPLLVVLSTRTENYDMVSGIMSPSILEYKSYQVAKNRFDSGSTAYGFPFLLEATHIGPSPVSSGSVSLLQLQASRRVASEKTNANSIDSITLTPGFGKMACRFVTMLLEKTSATDYAIRSQDINSLWWNTTSGKCLESPLISGLSSYAISRDGNSQIMYVYPHYESMGDKSQKLTWSLWDHIQPAAEGVFDANGQRYSFRVGHTSMVSAMMQFEQAYKKAAVYVLPITAFAVCCLFGFMFNSVGITIKVGLTVLLPLCGSYGLAVGAFQYGWFERFGIVQVDGGLSWLLFYTGMSFLFAMAVDYDMFLFARVYEYRHMGYDNDSSVIMALRETGPIITCAGSIMMLSFLTLCMTDQWMIQQVAFLYLIGVSVDTYIVRIFIAPAALCISEKWNYWPGKVPPVSKSLAD